MFGESESESPRVPSPWDSIVYTPPVPSPLSRSPGSPSPIAAELIPKLVPEADDGNVEYKLQLLSPSPARFARLVTQLKWRLLEGGGQAYYELGVADSGALIGLPRSELEQSLDTLELMAGEIGASVIVVKEIEVPAAMAGLAASLTDDWNLKRRKRREAFVDYPESNDASPNTYPTSATPTDPSGTDDDPDQDVYDLPPPIVLNSSSTSPPLSSSNDELPIPLFTLDLESCLPEDTDTDEADNDFALRGQVSFGLEISTVYKPRPFRARPHNHAQLISHVGKSKRASKTRKQKHLLLPSTVCNEPLEDIEPVENKHHKGHSRRQARDRRREEKRNALGDPVVNPALASANPSSNAATLVSSFEGLHVALTTSPPLDCEVVPSIQVVPDLTPDLEDDDDVFPSVHPRQSSHLAALSPMIDGEGGDSAGQARLIVEALVVRKMSMEEAFLDFEGFSLI